MNSHIQPHCERSTSCTYGHVTSAGEPCKTCISDGTFSHYRPASIGRPARERAIGDESPVFVANESGVMLPNPRSSITEQLKVSETCREATRRWKEAERGARINGDKDREKAIHRVLTEYLGNVSPNQIVTLPDPLTAKIEYLGLERFGVNIGRAICR